MHPIPMCYVLLDKVVNVSHIKRYVLRIIQADTYCFGKICLCYTSTVCVSVYAWVLNYVFQERYPAGCNKKIGGRSLRLKFPEISGISGIFPEFRGENSGVFSWFQAVIVCKCLQNGRFSGEDFRDFPGFSGISGNFPKRSRISPGFRGENSGVFSGFPAVIVCNHLQNDRFSGDDFRDFPEFPEFPKNSRKIPEFRNFGNPKNSRNFRKFPATGFFRNFLYFFIFYALWRLVLGYKKL
jgi:hypothetical protein